ncbi:hypothetical protein [Kiritimatiella glycovorans]|uniref:Uncharacterized protein n=1 Tax=Kiritimatiella glycovorans TaxID=1307763 RepID=A0A0G3ECH5_9BACT|nr:hypothetical protein [Kiritimatiella glycovorans]AKJ64211.1 hypothetical protein L21SP4_00949 [Kiritimatiella glycovorans]
MDDKEAFDFWYAVNNTRVEKTPDNKLETFGTTTVNYHLITPLMDAVDKVRLREGMLKADRPGIITPQAISDMALEGFGSDAREYAEWLRSNAQNLMILQYGFHVHKEEITQQIVTDAEENVLERVREADAVRNDPLSAIVVGVDHPWEVCLLKLMVELVQQSAAANVDAIRRRQQSRSEGLRREIEEDFAAASRDPSRISALAEKLEKRGLFKQYEDRFFALVRASEGKG